MDDSTRTQLILGAVTMAGPMGDDAAQWQGDVRRNVRSLVAMTSPRSACARLIDEVEGAKVFTGTVVAVKKEASSTRGLVTLHTGTDRSDDGTETARTDRTDSPDGLAMARSLRGLKGHRVMVWLYLEEFTGRSGAGKVRVIKHVEDLGEDKEAMARLVTSSNAA